MPHITLTEEQARIIAAATEPVILRDGQGEMIGVIPHPWSEAELTEAKNQLVAAALASRETAQGRAFELGEALVTYGDAKAADETDHDYQEVDDRVGVHRCASVCCAWVNQCGLVVVTALPSEIGGHEWPDETSTVIRFHEGKVVSMQDYQTEAEALAAAK